VLGNGFETVEVYGGSRCRVDPNHRVKTRFRVCFGGVVLLAVTAAASADAVLTNEDGGATVVRNAFAYGATVTAKATGVDGGQ